LIAQKGGNELTTVSVVTTTYSVSRSKYMYDCIKSLSRQTTKPRQVIVVLDDHGLYEHYGKELSDDVDVVYTNRKGLSNARNVGIRKADSEIVAFIDDDAVADTDWIKNLVENFSDEDVMAAGGLIKPLWEGRRPNWFPEELNWAVGCSYKGLPEHRTQIRNPIGCNMSFRKAVFDEVGFFNTNMGRFGNRLMGSEEPELCIRIRNRKPHSKIIYDPSAVVYHRVNGNRTNLKYLWRRSFFEGVSKATMKKYVQTPGGGSLSSENEYLRYLTNDYIPHRLRRIYKASELSNLLSVVFSMFGVFTGYCCYSIVGNSKKE
jgi:glycosyltransferase involved in cell wall biosynthesis